MDINLLGLKISVGHKADSEFTKEEVEAFINKEVEAFKKSFTYDKLFTTGHLLDVINSTRVTNPYETISTVYKSIKAICDNVPQADPAFFNEATGAEAADPKLMALLKKPNPRQNFVDFFQEWSGFYELHGETFILKTQSFGQAVGISGLPSQLDNLNPGKMVEIVDKPTDTLLGWRYHDGRQFTPQEILHTKDFNPYNKWRGLSPCKPIWDELQIDQATVDFNLAFFKNDGTPGFALSTDQGLTEDQRKRIEEWWEKRHKGTRNAFKMAVFEKGLKPMTITPSHKEMDFVSQKDLMRKEIMGIWRVPESLFNMTATVNYATFMGQMRVFWIYTLIPILNKFSSSITMDLVTPRMPGLVFDFDLMNVVAFQEQLGDKADVAEKLWKIGFTADELNDKLALGFKGSKPWRATGWVGWATIPAQDALDNPRVSQTVNDPTGIPPIDAPGEPGTPGASKKPKTPAPAPSKSVDTANKAMRRTLLVKNFNRRQTHVEKLFESKMSRFFNELRVEALKTPPEMIEKGIVNINWHKADATLRKHITPVMWLAINSGVSMGKDNVAPTKGIADDQLANQLSSYLSVKMNNIADLNDTVKDQLSETLKQGILDGSSSQMQRDELLATLTEGMKGVFNRAVTRAALIARTETVGAVNGGGLLYYRNIGVEKKSWITAHDDLVRESHQECEDQGDIDIDKQFDNGLAYPGDPNGGADEICNCRCVLAPAQND